MYREGFLLLIVFALLLTHSPGAIAKTPAEQSGWSAVASLPAGSELVVETRKSGIVKGRLTSTSDAGLSLSHKGKPTQLEASDVRKVFRVTGRSRAKTALIGAGVGAGVGTGAGIGVYAQGEFIGVTIPLFGVIGAGIGAGVGALFGGGKMRVLIYEAS